MQFPQITKFLIASISVGGLLIAGCTAETFY